MHHKYPNSIAYRWTLDVVSTPSKIAANIILLSFIGYYGIASERLSPIFLAVGGGVIPVVYTYFIYKLLRVISDKFTGHIAFELPDKKRLTIVCIADIILQLTFISLIITDILTSNLFRLIACPILPILQILSLRVLLAVYLKN